MYKPIYKRKRGEKVIAVLMARDWFTNSPVRTLYGGFFVVVEWNEYSNGKDVSYEGKMTHAMCLEKKYAKLIYDQILIERRTKFLL